jgi:hypothetical protein
MDMAAKLEVSSNLSLRTCQTSQLALQVAFLLFLCLSLELSLVHVLEVRQSSLLFYLVHKLMKNFFEA